jgi:hypothetical protein
MNFRFTALAIVCAFFFTLAGCAPKSPPTNTGGTPAIGGTPAQQQSGKITSAMSDSGFKASLTINDPPTKLRAGEVAILQVRVKNASDTNWPALGMEDGKYAITVRNRWLANGTDQVVNDLDGGSSLPQDLAAGAEVVLPLKVTAPKEIGEYILEVDVVQEQVAWFHDKGSVTARTTISVVR